MHVEIVGFAAPKSGSSAAEWEDAARFDEGWAPGSARLAIVDGATEAFDVIRWARQLVDGFVPAGIDAARVGGAAAPEIERASMLRWIAELQRQWIDESPEEFATFIEAEKFRTQGAYATFLGWQLDGLDDASGHQVWRAVAVGDAVLFQVRDGREIARFPDLVSDDFGTTPDLISTKPAGLERMAGCLRLASGCARAGDVLFFATDAFAHWIVQRTAEGRKVWDVLTAIDEQNFLRLVDDRRESGELHDDDVTLVRAKVVRVPCPVVLHQAMTP
jgi:hypothetical protein